MKNTVKQFNRLVFLKLPAAFICGVKLKDLNLNSCTTSVTLNWINKNPFKSIYFAVLAMAAELSTGALLLNLTKNNTYKLSTLVVGMKANFTKKAIGNIQFTCNDINLIKHHLNKAIETKEGVVFTLTSTGINKQNEPVARFEFDWSIKVK